MDGAEGRAARAAPGASISAGLGGRLQRLSPGWWLTGAVLAITTALWASGRIAIGATPDLWPWRGPVQLIGLWATSLLAVVLLAAARSRAIEPLFGGLDRAVRLHRRLGPMVVALMCVHAAFVVPATLSAGQPLADFFVPFGSPTARSMDSIPFYLLLVWTGLAYLRRLGYERWLWLHGLMGPIFLAVGAHSVAAGGTVQGFEPLRFWMWFLLLVGTAAWLWRSVLYRWWAPRYRYAVERVTPRGPDAVDLVLRPRDRRMIYEPGSFVFIGLPGTGWRRPELHPFSISSSPAERDLRLSIRTVGDFTGSIP
ncbi:MAG: ferric reductase-like transmembrane domain-containing protein, partial [Alphaproteobacteria bacterium]